ncbi:META domain-containing protein [Leucobacter chromiiresistens]|uniref:Heat shock protein HslJ n=2 Tax=Leucobacter chromiiresistens TaxID=1079994 RepID=A0A1H0YS05_9MICO|nr:META domain-containing protein [Leucobacter chromiiresistens]SDQ17711.1 Heat shock protein HslJ [Leucobacter chromiiresistens]
MKRRMRWAAGIAAVVGGAALLVGCASLSADGSGTDGETGDAEMIEQADVVGTWFSDEQGKPTLTFDESGKVSGTDGCNGIGSTYTIEGDRVRIENFVSTMMACPGVDDWLRGVSEVQLSGDELQVFNDSGDEIGTLQRQV